MVYASLQMADDAGADTVGANARSIRTLNESRLGEVFGVTAIPARLALERGIWAEAATLERPVHDLTALNEDLEGMLALLSCLDEYTGVSNTNMHLRAAAGRTARMGCG